MSIPQRYHTKQNEPSPTFGNAESRNQSFMARIISTDRTIFPIRPDKRGIIRVRVLEIECETEQSYPKATKNRTQEKQEQ